MCRIRGATPARAVCRESLLAVRAVNPALLGILALFIAGFVRGLETNSRDPELVLAASYALGGCGLMGVLAAGVAFGIRLSRD
jgi:hypothetical protein